MSMEQIYTLISIISAGIGLIGTIIGGAFAITNWIKLMKNKSTKQIWDTVAAMADSAMKEYEQSGKTGVEKKQLVIDSVKAAAKAAGLNIDSCLDQLSTYIDQCVDFANSFNKNK